ncbi:hypothetical protein ACFFMN_06460 [Planobispora siamensis]|uniref:Secreted protein n=1 Tax=Planobispora siamensis TaxID=936338 RepID=A0A8J3SNV4_9ACTN|nr:hypothetical protein [Planobispora siamensis]GIH97841.1 hypothetical protein Psi01_84710 [Planobispora siamensis]
MRKKFVAPVLVGAALSLATIAAAAPASASASGSASRLLACKEFSTNTGGGINMEIRLKVCGTGNYVDYVEGYVINRSGSYAHAGHVRLRFSNGEEAHGSTVNVPPGRSGGHVSMDPNKNYSSGTRVCSAWIKTTGTVTPGYACATIG